MTYLDGEFLPMFFFLGRKNFLDGATLNRERDQLLKNFAGIQGAIFSGVFNIQGFIGRRS